MKKLNTNILIPEEKFEKLAKHNNFYCISLYIPLKNNEKKLDGKEILKTQIEQLTYLLASENIRGHEAGNYLNPIRQLLNITDLWFTSKEDVHPKTLVIFANENSIYHFKINSYVENQLYITSNFYLLPLFEKATKYEINENFNQENLIINRVEKIIPLAFEGKIDTLYVSSTNGIYGVYDNDNKTTMIDEKKGNTNMSLLNLAALQTYLHKGKVCLIDPNKMSSKGVSIQAIIKDKSIP
ncbi:MAG: hypothetical protein CMD31_08915 [Flavobacteriales bacterium]|jgi:hypothetical protein|nr:hypothetical protein [Flavobacteriales bacterium]MBQ20862.1 hypothetical protein [Flavobacteriales bacterium]|tara:strand:+ start:74041 stop:74760 length:720 start_codon:yes stop_codon:yes gene_type:complete